VFYYQERIGYHNQYFDIIKFATMLKNSPNMGTGSITLRKDPRVLPIGGFLRKTKINELPQILNVIKGDMSLVGPRPLVDLVPEPWQGRLRRTAYIPSLAYRLAMIAAGKLDATFVKPSAHDWDIAAADLILTEAGGALVDRGGAPPRYAGEIINHGALAAGSGELLGVLAGVLAGLDEG